MSSTRTMYVHPLFKWCCNNEGLPTAAHEPQWGALERRMEPAQPGIRAPTHGVLPQWAGQRGVLLQWTSQAKRGQPQYIRTPAKSDGTPGKILLGKPHFLSFHLDSKSKHIFFIYILILFVQFVSRKTKPCLCTFTFCIYHFILCFILLATHIL